jgi:hypothetical protein
MSALFLFVAITLLIVGSTSLAQAPVKPGPEHEMLQKTAGTWDAAMKAVDGTEAKGTGTSRMQCGGLWLVANFRMEMGGQQFQGRSFDGYDIHKKKFVTVWVDSMSTSPMLFEGDYDKASKTLTMTGEGKGPDGKTVKAKSLTIMKDEDHHTFKMFIIDADGKEQLMMTIEYTRKK